MKRRTWVMVAVIVLSFWVEYTCGQEEKSSAFGAKVSFEMASAYVFRGATYNDGVVLQPCVEGSWRFLKLGAWANYDVNDYSGALEDDQLSEVDLYALISIKAGVVNVEAGYRKYFDKYVHILPPADVVYATKAEAEAGAAAGVERQRAYPRPDLAVDDAGEVSLQFEYPAEYTPSLAVYRGLDGCLKDTTYVVAGVSHEYYDRGDWRVGMGLSLTYLDQPDGESGFSHYMFTHTVKYKFITAAIGYISPTGEKILIDSDEGGPLDIRGYGSIGFSRRF